MTDVRLDKWLWAARLFKTRGLAAEAVAGGKVHLNGARTKPAKTLRVGDVLEVRRGPVATVVTVRGLADRRGPAPVAAELYEETPESRAAREAFRAQRAAPVMDRGGRPSKHDRRAAARLRRGER